MLRETDLVPFADGIAAGADAVMLAPVTYPAIDARPAGCSRIWVEDILRGEFGFRGVVLGDDIGMAATESLGGIGARIEAHLLAGCDLVLACSASIVPEALAASQHAEACAPEKVAALQGAVAQTWQSLADNPQRNDFVARVTALDDAAVDIG
jgi:beta-N-acetylhexosaminidase